MSFNDEKRNAIKKYMLEKIRKDDENFIRKTAETFAVSETSVRRYLKSCEEERIISVDPTKYCRYILSTVEKTWPLKNDGSLEEDRIFFSNVRPLLENLPKNVLDIWSYVFAEIMNNAIEHSEATEIKYSIKRDCLYTEVSILDNGIGIFKSIQDFIEKEENKQIDIEQAMLELYKGKLTTNPSCHSGEGIFFSSKMLTEFAILSDNTIFSFRSDEKEKFVQSHLISYYTKLKKVGTMVVMRLENDTITTSKDVFDSFAPLEEGFIKTLIPMREVCPLGNPVARSQARRILKRLDEFKEVIFDFNGIEFMGQGFADEIFRVFQNAHPDIVLRPINANEAVLGMIQHVIRA